MNVLLDIRPDSSWQAALNGVQRFVIVTHRFTRSDIETIFRGDIKTIFLYATSPIEGVAGYFSYGGTLVDTPERVWSITKGDVGVSREFFNRYYRGETLAFAIKVRSHSVPIRFDAPIPLSTFTKGVKAPPSFHRNRPVWRLPDRSLSETVGGQDQ